MDSENSINSFEIKKELLVGMSLFLLTFKGHIIYSRHKKHTVLIWPTSDFNCFL